MASECVGLRRQALDQSGNSVVLTLNLGVTAHSRRRSPRPARASGAGEIRVAALLSGAQ